MLIMFLCAFVFILLGAIFSVIANCMRLSRKKAEKVCITPISAMVVDVVSERISNSMQSTARSYSCFPVYEYTYNSETIRHKSNVGGKPDTWHVGDRTVLMVDPDNPKKIYNPHDRFKWIANLFSCFGIGMIVIGIVVLIFAFIL